MNSEYSNHDLFEVLLEQLNYLSNNKKAEAIIGSTDEVQAVYRMTTPEILLSNGASIMRKK